MAKARLLNKVVLTSQKINKISEGAENFYYRILLLVDDYGRYYADLDILKSHAYPKRKKNADIIRKRLNELINIKLLRKYKDGKEEYLELNQFEKYQRFRKDINRSQLFPIPKRFYRGHVTHPSTSVTSRKRDVTDVNRNRNRNNNKNINRNRNEREAIIAYLNERTGKNFDHNSKITTELINGRLSEGRSLDDFKYVIEVKVEQWLNDSEMDKFLRPSTLFRSSNFESYLNEKIGLSKVNKKYKGIMEWYLEKEKEQKQEDPF